MKSSKIFSTKLNLIIILSLILVNGCMKNDSKIKYLLKKAEKYVNLKDYEKVCHYSSTVLEIDSLNYTAIYYHAISLDNLNEREKALAEYSKYLGVMNNIEGVDSTAFSNAYNNRAYCLLRMGEYESALEDYTEALNYNPKNHKALDGIARTYVKGYDELGKGFYYIDQAVKEKPDELKYRLYRGTHSFLLLTEHELEYTEEIGNRILEDINLVINSGIDNARLSEAYFCRSNLNLYKIQENIIESDSIRMQSILTDLNKAIDGKPFYILYQAYFVRAVLYDRYFNKPQNALADYTKAIELGFGNLANMARGKLNLFHFEDFNSAKLDYEKCIETFSEDDKDYVLTNIYLSIINYRLGGKQKAIEHFRKANKKNPGYWKKLSKVGKFEVDLNEIIEMDNLSK